MTLLQTYADFGVRFLEAEPSEELLRHAKRAVVDWLGSLISGIELEPTTNLVASCRDELGMGQSSVIGFGTTAVPATAAWLNGTASHASEMDDSFRPAVLHPGCPVIAAALALAEARDMSGTDLLKAIIVGYEITTRIGAAVQPAHIEYFHATGTVGVFGAAAAAAALLSPRDAARQMHAMAIGATFTSGLQQAVQGGGNTKPLHAGNAAQVGLRAAQAAAHGVTGAPDMLEGRTGFGAAMAGNPTWAGATDGLGEVFNITRPTHKVHACCGHQFLEIDTVLLLKERHGIEPGQVESIDIVTYRQALDAVSGSDPRSPYEAKFSMPYVVSHALLHGSVALDAFRPQRLNQPELRALMARVKLAEDPEMTAGFPRSRQARVAITLKDGTRHEHLATFRRGDPEWPLSDAELNQKFLDLSRPVVGEARAAELLDLVWRLDRLKVRDLQLMRKG